MIIPADVLPADEMLQIARTPLSNWQRTPSSEIDSSAMVEENLVNWRGEDRLEIAARREVVQGAGAGPTVCLKIFNHVL